MHAEHTRRVFFAAQPDPDTCAALHQATEKLHERVGPGLRLSAVENWHLTLRFVGDVAPQLIDPLAVALSALAADHGGCVVPLNRIEPFPNHARPAVIAATGPVVPAAQRLVDDLDRRCRGLGLAPETRPWRPHVSLARHKGRRVLEGWTLDIEVRMRLDDVLLMESVASPGGRRYVTLAHAPLSAESTRT